ncbi:MAG: GTP-binding protein, partial [Clostridium sp.]
MKVIVDIFSGFLGSGKTMLIKKFLSEHAYSKNTVIIENEFGEVSIDGEILRESNIEVKEINSGCICCQVSGKFDDAVFEVINKYNPEQIIIEPSGVAKLSEILNILTNIKFSHMLEIRNVFTLIDILNYEKYVNNFKEFYINQIENADTIVLSRTQFKDKKFIDDIIKSLKKLNAHAEIIYKPWEELKANDFMKKNGLLKRVKNQVIKPIHNGKGSLMKKHVHNHTAGEVFESYPIRLEKYIDEKELEDKFKLIEQSEHYGNIVRVKGIIENNKG